jgi:hypothetical protein
MTATRQRPLRVVSPVRYLAFDSVAGEWMLAFSTGEEKRRSSIDISISIELGPLLHHS